MPLRCSKSFQCFQLPLIKHEDLILSLEPFYNMAPTDFPIFISLLSSTEIISETDLLSLALVYLFLYSFPHVSLLEKAFLPHPLPQFLSQENKKINSQMKSSLIPLSVIFSPMTLKIKVTVYVTSTALIIHYSFMQFVLWWLLLLLLLLLY